MARRPTATRATRATAAAPAAATTRCPAATAAPAGTVGPCGPCSACCQVRRARCCLLRALAPCVSGRQGHGCRALAATGAAWLSAHDDCAAPVLPLYCPCTVVLDRTAPSNTEDNALHEITLGSLLGWGSYGRVHRGACLRCVCVTGARATPPWHPSGCRSAKAQPQAQLAHTHASTPVDRTHAHTHAARAHRHTQPGYWNGSLVAVKVLEQVAGDFNPRSSLEPLLHHRLSHPNVVAMFDVVTQVRVWVCVGVLGVLTECEAVHATAACPAARLIEHLATPARQRRSWMCARMGARCRRSGWCLSSATAARSATPSSAAGCWPVSRRRGPAVCHGWQRRVACAARPLCAP
jgi:hypothetical protein